MEQYTVKQIADALKAFQSSIAKCEKVKAKLKEGSPQKKFIDRQLDAFYMVVSFLDSPQREYTENEIFAALDTLNLLIQKCEKMREKFAADSPQRTLLERRIRAFQISVVLIEQSASREKYMKEVTVGEQKTHNAKITLKEYDPQWAMFFSKKAEKIKKALGNKVIQIEHVGSTAVPELCAKPIIDILLVVKNSANESEYAPALENSGYILRIREPDWFEHRMFIGTDIDCNLHVFSEGASEIKRMLLFRDRLRADKNDRELYAAAKRSLAEREWKYIQNYADAKSEVVEEIMKRAENSQ